MIIHKVKLLIQVTEIRYPCKIKQQLVLLDRTQRIFTVEGTVSNNG